MRRKVAQLDVYVDVDEPKENTHTEEVRGSDEPNHWALVINPKADMSARGNGKIHATPSDILRQLGQAA